MPLGEITLDPHSLQQAFCDYFAALYSLATPSSLDLDPLSRHTQEYIHETAIPKLDENIGKYLDSPFLLEELLEVIPNTPSGKRTGPDGFTSKCYKTYKEHITPFMLWVFNMFWGFSIPSPSHINAILTSLLR